MPTNILRFDGNLTLNGHVVEGVMPAPAGATYTPVTTSLALAVEGGSAQLPAVNTATFLRHTHRGVQGFSVEQTTTNLVDPAQGATGVHHAASAWGRQTVATATLLSNQHTPDGRRQVAYVRWYDSRAAGTSLGGLSTFRWSPLAAQHIPVTPGATYTASFTMRSSLDASQLHINTIYVRQFDSDGTQVFESGGAFTTEPLADGWARLSRTFTVGANTTKIIVQTYSYLGDGAMWAYDAQVEQTGFATSFTAGTRPRGELRYDNLPLGAQGTVSVWVQARQISSGFQHFLNLGKMDGTGNHMIGLMHANAASDLSFVYTNAASDIRISAGATSAWLNTWRHVAFTWSGTTLRFYLDGNLHWEGAVEARDVRRLYIGGWIGNMPATAAEGPNARYAHLITAPTALSAGDIAQLYTQQRGGQLMVQDNRLYAPYRWLEGEMPTPAGFTQASFRAGTDLTGDRTVQATTSNVTLDPQAGRWGGAVYMGTTERLEYPLGGSDSGTMMWMYRPSNPAGTLEVMMDSYDVTNARMWYSERTTTGRFRLWVSGLTVFDSAADISAANTWHHLAFTWSPAGVTLYVNGVPDTTRTGLPVGLRDFQRLMLRYSSAAHHPNAWYASVMHARRQLSASEVADIARLALTGDFSVKDGAIHVRQSITEGAF